MHLVEDVWPLETEDSHDSKPQLGHRGNGHVPHGLECEFDMVSGLDRVNYSNLRDWIQLVVLLRLRRFELFNHILEAGHIKGLQSEHICHTITASNM